MNVAINWNIIYEKTGADRGTLIIIEVTLDSLLRGQSA